jgi:hypothetical protein
MHGINTGHVTSAASLSRSNSSEGLDRKVSGDSKVEHPSSIPVISGTSEIEGARKLAADQSLVESGKVVTTNSADA